VNESARNLLGSASRDLPAIESGLRKWDGANAVLLGTGLSHRCMWVEVWKEGRETQLLVVCIGPYYHCGPIHWTNTHLRIAAVSEAERIPFQAEFELLDEASGVRLVGPEFQLLEEPAPHWRRKGGAEPPDIPPLERTGPAV
jgi:hypothetical protein